jgi:hypothetical protein
MTTCSTSTIKLPFIVHDCKLPSIYEDIQRLKAMTVNIIHYTQLFVSRSLEDMLTGSITCLQ